uniref:At1g61320/AtMIF1 LRR domain-containing protein n=1 Tax=Ananas comosus var. bracteatus TaxID=296719 RepID=A0A6V7QW29_ANACO
MRQQFSGLKDGPTTIRKLSLKFSAEKKDVAMLDGWILSALERGVCELKLSPGMLVDYVFPPQSLNSGGYSLTKLKLCQCSLSNHAGFSMFGSLSSLSLEDMRISKDDMQGVLQNCRRLKSLYLAHCSLCDTDLSIAPPDLQLKELAIYTDLAGTNYILRKLSTDLPRSRSLNLVFRSYKDVEVPCPPARPPARFGNLKSLTVNVVINSKKDLLWMAILLEAAPFLETLQTCVKASDYYSRFTAISWKPSDFVHRHLEEVKMYNFEGNCGEMAFARLLLAKAVDLKSITFTRDYLFALAGWKLDHTEYPKQWTEQQTSVLLKQFTEGISTSARLVFR